MTRLPKHSPRALIERFFVSIVTLVQYLGMKPADVAKNIKQIYKNAAQQIRGLHKKRLNLLREILERRAREKAQKKSEGGYQFDNTEIKKKAQNIMATYEKGMDEIENLRRDGLEIIEEAEQAKSKQKADQIRQSIGV